MLEQRSLKTDVFALVVLGLTIFLGAALLTYDPADPPSKLVYPEHSQITNVCGKWGAWTSFLLFTSIGVGAYYLLLTLAVLDFALLARRQVTDFFLRTVGWALSLVGLTTLMATALPQLSPGPVIGSGGYLGAAGRGLLETNFALVGGCILSVSLILCGLLLCTDYLLLRIAGWIMSGPVLALANGLLHVVAAYGQKFGWKVAASLTQPRVNPSKSKAAPRKTDDLSSPDASVAVRFPGRNAEETTDAESSKSESDAPAEPSQETEEEQPSERRSLTSMLFGRKLKKEEKETEEETKDVIEKLEAATLPNDDAQYQLPPVELLLAGEPFSYETQEEEVLRRAKILEKTFADFGFNIRVAEIQTGPVIAQYEVELEAGLRLSRITGLADDLAIALRVPSVRIVAPIPGKNTVGVEVPNTERQLVRMREVIEEANGKAQKMRIPLYLGKDVAGAPMVVDLTTLPHLLIAGRTGTGKSVCLNTIICSMVMTRRPDEVRMLMIDPKMVELSPYKSLPHLMHPVVTDMRKAEAILGWAVEKMEERYQLLARAGVRHVSVYNQLGEDELMERIQPENDEERQMIPRQMPYIVIVADEMADLMMTAAKEVETHIIRLAQKSRAVGIHLVLATQKPTVDVITGLIKSNLPARISFQVASRTDSRVVLDEMGAEKLLGNGDMLFLWPGTSTLLRGQGTYLSDDEITKVIGAVATSEPDFVKELVQLKASEPEGSGGTAKGNGRDDLYDAAVDIVIREGRGSVSLLQRSLGIGYGRAARLIDFMAEDGIVGTYAGSQAREVLITLEDWAAMNGKGGEEGTASAAPPRRPTNRILLTPPEEPAAPPPARPAASKPEALPPVDSDEPSDEKPEQEKTGAQPRKSSRPEREPPAVSRVSQDDSYLEEEEDEEGEEVEDEEEYGDEDVFGEEESDEEYEEPEEDEPKGRTPPQRGGWRAESA
jgi:S-DNA-T family DNA segregation ATPase FtsK/SpoIIIE